MLGWEAAEMLLVMRMVLASWGSQIPLPVYQVFWAQKADRECFLISMINGILHDNYVYRRTDVLITRSLKTSNEL